ncbi:hypothetical protein E3T61_09855 [Cryobacterium lactosi]|uniref:Uncharacterized protein n=1 Tax=Cryobacterium lactosi TaxID=1259202 RepID=A0A4R9BU05_9MICO|nr:hypothetical protein [Cryobacterium lactosi]TFD90808.1 hypothetical protein E3T61_09855 [Cryobacterium lactosi]
MIEDFLLTKATLLITQKAPISEWLFEIEAMAVLSGERWERNHFLLGYTVARLVTAQKSQGIHSAPEREPTTALLTAFVDDFTHSVGQDDVAAAHRIWAQTAADHADANSATPLISLVSRVQTRPVGQSWGAIAQHLPAPSLGVPEN